MDLSKILCTLMDKLLQQTRKKELKKASCRKVRAAYAKKIVGKADSIKYDKIDLKCAYLYMYGPSHSSMLLRFLKEFEKEWESFNSWFDAIMERGKMRICAVGGGPGLETILTYLWLQLLIQRWNSKRASSEWKNLSLVKLQVVDLNEGWKSVFKTFHKTVRKSLIASFVNNCQVQFIQADLLSDHSKETQAAIANSDLILMVKFVSAVSKEVGCATMLQRIMDQMKAGALLFAIDGINGTNKHLLKNAASGCCQVMEPVFEKSRTNFKVNSMLRKTWKSRYGKRFGGNGAHLQSGNQIFARVLRKTGKMKEDVLHSGGVLEAQASDCEMDVSYEELSGELWDDIVDSTSDNYHNTSLLNELVAQLPLRTPSPCCWVLEFAHFRCSRQQILGRSMW